MHGSSRFAIVCCLLSTLLVSAACTRIHSESLGTRNDDVRPATLTVADKDEPRTLNPLLIGGLSEDLQALLFSCLLRSGPRGELIPDIAVRIPSIRNGDVSRDGRSISYTLRSGVAWQDGVPLTARDVIYTYEQIMNPNNNTGARIPYTDVASISAPDDRTVHVRLKRVDAAFVPKFFAGSFCWGILPRHLLRGYAALNEIPFNAMPVGSGPYVVGRWLRGDRLELEPNPRYFRGAPHFRIIDRFIPNRSTIVTQLRTGELDADFRADPAEASAAAGNPGLHIWRTPFPATGTLLFNVSDSIVRSAQMRRALSLSIDAEAAARSVSLGLYTTKESNRAAFAWAYDRTVHWPHYNPSAAARMFDALGWKLHGNGIRYKDGHPLALTLISSGEGLDPAFCVVLQFQLRRAGVDVTLKTFDASTFYAPASSGGPLRTGAFELAYVPQYYIDFDADLSSALRCDRQPPKGYNFGHYCNAAVDAANRRALETLDTAQRKQYYRVVQQQLASDPPWLTLWRMTKVDIMTRQLHGFVATPRYDPYYDVQNWRLER